MMARGRKRSKKQNGFVQPEGDGSKLKHVPAKPKGPKQDKVGKENAHLNLKRFNPLSNAEMKDNCSVNEISSKPNLSSSSACNDDNFPDGSSKADYSENITGGSHTDSEKHDNIDNSKLGVLGTMGQLNGCKKDNSQAMCDYCAVTFESDSALKIHCHTEAHQIAVMSDEGRSWKYRPPPRGFTAVDYTLCENWDKICKYGEQCVEAHSVLELQEWRKRFEYRHSKIQQAEQQNLLAKSYTEQLLEKWSHTKNPDNILKEKVDYVEDSVTENQLTTTISKDCRTDWTFLIKTTKALQAVALLQYADRNRFTVKCVKSVVGGQHIEWLVNTSEWTIPQDDHTHLESLTKKKQSSEFRHSVCIEFLSDIYGTFRQTVAFDFGEEPLLVKHLCVDVRPASFATNVEELKKELFMDERWDESNAEIVKFNSVECDPARVLHCASEDLLKKYPTPTPSTFTLTQSTVTERMATRNNYCSRMHELLGVEEMARYQQVARYNIRAKLTITKSYLLAPAGTAFSTAKFAQNNHMYAVMKLSQALSEDTAGGRLILNNCTTVLLCAAESTDDSSKSTFHNEINEKKSTKRRVFEALIEDKGKNVIYLKLSADTVKEYGIVGGSDFNAEVQFQLNRLQYCEWHHAVDNILDCKILFPETFLEPDVPWTPHRQWKELKDAKLNVKQKEAIVAITTPLNIKLPPVLIIGPFGTGKTYTLAQAIKQLLAVPDYRILVCTHSNSAADIYINDYLHSYVEEGHKSARPLRIYYHNRWVSTVHPTVQQYCLTETVNGAKRFRLPEKEDLENHRVVVVTLSMSMVLTALGLEKGFFTHIFLDEAAQAMECEAIMPLAMAGDTTRIVLAGDHMQLNPELFSPFAKERNLHMSLLERLYDHYPTSFPCKILLTENYRAHEAIIKFTSDLFYDQKLVSSGRQPKHPQYYPLTFYSCRGEDVQEINSTGHYNLAEVYEIAERVTELRNSWPTEWGELNNQSIGIMTPYADQVFRIRCELRRKKLGSISVERVLNVQGKQFRAIFISTVRTRRTCSGSLSGSTEESEFGFLSNSKLLNTAITRAQSLVVVVGDPIALCSLGKCRKVWERYIQICDENKSLFGIPWSTIQSHLDGVEFKPNYGLNPLAPEFIPMGYNSPYYRGCPIQRVPDENDSYVFNGYHSHLSFFDQNSRGQRQPASLYRANNYRPAPRPRSRARSGKTETNATMAAGNAHPQQQGPLEVVQPSAPMSGPEGSMHYIPPSTRGWSGPGFPVAAVASSGDKLIMPGVAVLNSNNFANAPLQPIPNTAIQRIEFQSFPPQQAFQPFQQYPQHLKLLANGHLHPSEAAQITFPVHQQVMLQQVTPQVPSQTIQASVLPHQVVPSPQCHQLNGLVQQPIVQATQPHQIENQDPQISQQLQQQQQQMQLQQLQQLQHQQQLQQQLRLQQQQQQLQQRELHLHQIQQLQPLQLQQQQQQLHQVLLQQQQQQLLQHQQFQQHQQIHQQHFQHLLPQQEPFTLEQQLRLQHEQQRWQQYQHVAILLEQRKSLLGHVLTPLVNCNPLWNQLIPRGVNLLDMVDNKSQQEEWWNHLMTHGQSDLAKRFASFMALCTKTLAAVISEPKEAVSTPFLGSAEPCDLNSKEVSTAVSVPEIQDVDSYQGPCRTSLNSDTQKTDGDSEEQVIMMKDLDPAYMLGNDPFLNGGKSVWAIAQHELAHCSLNGTNKKNQNKPVEKPSPKSESFDSDDSGDELLSSIDRQLRFQQSDD